MKTDNFSELMRNRVTVWEALAFDEKGFIITNQRFINPRIRDFVKELNEFIRDNTKLPVSYSNDMAYAYIYRIYYLQLECMQKFRPFQLMLDYWGIDHLTSALTRYCKNEIK